MSNLMSCSADSSKGQCLMVFDNFVSEILCTQSAVMSVYCDVTKPAHIKMHHKRSKFSALLSQVKLLALARIIPVFDQHIDMQMCRV